MNLPLLGALALTVALLGVRQAGAQISMSSAVDLALRNSPRVKSSEAEVRKARAALAETKDIFIPSVNAGAGLGEAVGYSPNPPTLFNVNAQSLIYNMSQKYFIRSARAGLDAAQQNLEDVREAVAEDAALAFVALDHDQERDPALRQQADYAARLLAIVQDRFDSGQDSRMDLNGVRLTVAQLRVARLRAEQDTRNDRDHLARLMGVPSGSLRTDGGFPSTPLGMDTNATTEGYANPQVAAAFQSARARQLQAYGDSRNLYRPQFSLVAQYQRYATFTDAFSNLNKQYVANNKDGKGLSPNEYVIGVQISIPIFDRFRVQKNIESTADASKALHDAESAQMNALDAQGRLSHSIELLRAQAEVAALEQQRAQLQLEDVQLRLTTPLASGPPMTPKDEQNARISEREKFLATLDRAFDLHQAEVSLLRQTGHLESWLFHGGLTAAPSAASTPQAIP